MSSTGRKHKRMTLIHDSSEISAFANEAGARAYWETHAFSEELLAKVKVSRPRHRKPVFLAGLSAG